MTITHQLIFRMSDEKQKFFESLGFTLKQNKLSSHVFLSVKDTNPRWIKIKSVIKRFDIWDSYFVEYSPQELEQTEWFQIKVSESLYPQPEDNFKYRSLTYDLNNYFPTCGIGYEQNRPFRLSSDFPHKSYEMMGLHWENDAFFIRCEGREILEKEEISGISFSHPIFNKSQKPITTTYQINVTTILPPGYIVDKSEIVTCMLHNEEHLVENGRIKPPVDDSPFCGRVKYHLRTYPPLTFRKEIFQNAPDFVKTSEWFGSGYGAHRIILVSHKVYTMSARQKWKGIKFWPVELK